MFWGFCFVLFVILKSLSLRIVRAGQHCPQPRIYLHSPANVNQESKSQTEEALNGVIRGRSDFQLSVRGPGLLAGQRIVLSHKPTVWIGSQSPCGGCGFLGLHLQGEAWLGAGGSPAARRPALGLGGFQRCLLTASGALSKSLSCAETQSLFICLVTSSALAGGENRWRKPPARNSECCKMW